MHGYLNKAQSIPGNANTGTTNRTRQVTRMGNKSGSGPFTPLVVVARNVIGKKDFNQLRGKAISLHSQGELSHRIMRQYLRTILTFAVGVLYDTAPRQKSTC